ncbi:MAG: flagellar M-ring protein FliF, partial [Gammaproteobacteria bacterium]|nr:flagellar M-ring protein FliF [Gammaproteobacteria bacterium]
MANPASQIPLLNSIRSFSELPFVRQLLAMVILASSIALGAVVVMWSMSSGYTALYTGLSTQDSADVMSALEQNSLRYRVDGSSGLIMVPADQLRQTRMQLASEGLPRSTNRGFEILNEDQGLGTSNFVEQARYNRALEQELVQTIKQIQGVRDARVHLSIPKQNSFIRNSRQPSASVIVDITGLQAPGDSQISGITHLVASSVAGLETDNVSVVNQRGDLLSANSNSELAQSAETIRYTRTIEDNYKERILDILTPVVGAGNVKAQVNARLDFTRIDTTEEVYNPETAAIRSSQIQEEKLGSPSAEGTTEPGALSNTPPAEGEGDGATESNSESTQSSSIETINYEIDRTLRNTVQQPGRIEQLSVAVLVDLSATQTTAEDGTVVTLSPEQVQARTDNLTQLVRDAVGFDADRGDTVNVINEAFFTSEPLEIAEIPMWQQAGVLTAAKQAGAGFVVLLLI